MKTLLNISTANLLRAGGLFCALCFVFLCGCNDSASSRCEITVSAAGSICNIRYYDSNSISHTVVIQSDSEVITIQDCVEVLSVNCSG